MVARPAEAVRLAFEDHQFGSRRHRIRARRRIARPGPAGRWGRRTPGGGAPAPTRSAAWWIGRPLPVDVDRLRQGADQAVQVAGLEVVGVGGQRQQIGDPVPGHGAGEHPGPDQRGQGGQAPGTRPPGWPSGCRRPVPRRPATGRRPRSRRRRPRPRRRGAGPGRPGRTRAPPVVDGGNGDPPAGRGTGPPGRTRARRRRSGPRGRRPPGAAGSRAPRRHPDWSVGRTDRARRGRRPVPPGADATCEARSRVTTTAGAADRRRGGVAPSGVDGEHGVGLGGGRAEMTTETSVGTDHHRPGSTHGWATSVIDHLPASGPPAGGSQDDQGVPAPGAHPGRQRTVGQLVEGVLTEHPVRAVELRLDLDQWSGHGIRAGRPGHHVLQHSRWHPVREPPARAVVDEDQSAVCGPAGLAHRDPRATGHVTGVAQADGRGRGVERGDPQQGWRPTACPGGPRCTRPASARPADGRGAATKSPWSTRTTDPARSDRWARPPAGGWSDRSGDPLLHRDQPLAVGRDPAVGVADVPSPTRSRSAEIAPASPDGSGPSGTRPGRPGRRRRGHRRPRWPLRRRTRGPGCARSTPGATRRAGSPNPPGRPVRRPPPPGGLPGPVGTRVQ